MTGQIDQDIDLVGLDARGKLFVRHLPGVDPDIGQGAALRRHAVLCRRARITGEPELLPVMIPQHGQKGQRGRMRPEVRGDIADGEAPFRIQITQRPRPLLNVAADPPPPFASHRLVLGEVAVGHEIQREDLCGDRIAVVRLDLEGPLEMPQ